MGADTNRRNFGHVVKFIASFLLGWFLTEKNFQDLSPVIGGLILALFYMVFLAVRYFRSEKAQKEMKKTRNDILPVLTDLRQRVEDGRVVLGREGLFSKTAVEGLLAVAEGMIAQTEDTLQRTNQKVWTDEQESRSISSLYLTFLASLTAMECQLETTIEEQISAQVIISLGKLTKAALYFQDHKEASVLDQFKEATWFLEEGMKTRNIKDRLLCLELSNQKFQAIIDG